MEINIGDVIRVAFGNPLDAIAAALKRQEEEEEALAEQVRPATQVEQAAMEKVATETASLQDELSALVGDKQTRLKNLRKDLTGRMIKHGLKELKIAGRPAIELTTTRSRKGTRKSIVAAMVAKLGEKEGKMKGTNLWNAIAFTDGVKLTIPAPLPESGDVEANY